MTGESASALKIRKRSTPSVIFSEWSRSSSSSLLAVEAEEAVVGGLVLVDQVGHLAHAPVGLVLDLARRLELRLRVGGDLLARSSPASGSSIRIIS